MRKQPHNNMYYFNYSSLETQDKLSDSIDRDINALSGL